MAVLAARQFDGSSMVFLPWIIRVPTCSVIHAFTVTRVYIYANYGLE